jgi:hypothetical protein
MTVRDGDIAPPEPDRYTLDGDDAVEARIAADQALIAGAVREVLAPPAFRALVLMGGYGRGEGGYVVRDGQPRAYNDYDYFVVVRDLRGAHRDAAIAALADKARDLERDVGVEVDFALLPEAGLPSAEYTLMNAEMIWGHRVVAGDPQVLEAMPPMPFSGLPAGEFTRLLLNRGALLLMNQVSLAGGQALSDNEREVFFKYLFKAVLACGDARLAGDRSYHPSYVKKLALLQSGEAGEDGRFLDYYVQAWENKFHPNYGRYAGADAGSWQRRVVRIWLDTLSWFEGRRTGGEVADWTAYGSPSVPKGQGRRSWGGLRNLAITLRDFGPGQVLRQPRWSLRYPRERLISVLPLLLQPGAGVPGPQVAAAVATPPGSSWQETAAAFLRLWRRYA